MSLLITNGTRTTKGIELPSVHEFSERIDAVVASGAPDVRLLRPYDTLRALSFVAGYGWTRDWRHVASRFPALPTPEYVRSIAAVLVDPDSYSAMFSAVDDEIEVTPYGEVANGCHRVLAAKCLGADVVKRAGVDAWAHIRIVPY